MGGGGVAPFCLQDANPVGANSSGKPMPTGHALRHCFHTQSAVRYLHLDWHARRLTPWTTALTTLKPTCWPRSSKANSGQWPTRMNWTMSRADSWLERSSTACSLAHTKMSVPYAVPMSHHLTPRPTKCQSGVRFATKGDPAARGAGCGPRRPAEYC